MKVEALVLAIASRVLEVGLRPRSLKPEVLEVDCACSCECHHDSFGYLELAGGLLVGLALGVLVILGWWSRSVRYEPQPSPRRKGRGVIRHPGRDDSG